MAEWLPHINATLNAVATVLLCVGLIMIKQKRESSHKVAMLSCFGVSVVFLICYLAYHAQVGSKKFPTDLYPMGAYLYYPVLATHVILAATVPFLAVAAIYFGWRERREQHRKVVRWAFPIWLYVSVTGVLVYGMLYWVFPPEEQVVGAVQSLTWIGNVLG